MIMHFMPAETASPAADIDLSHDPFSDKTPFHAFFHDSSEFMTGDPPEPEVSFCNLYIGIADSSGADSYQCFIISGMRNRIFS
jgi:hypothetical protein